MRGPSCQVGSYYRVGLGRAILGLGFRIVHSGFDTCRGLLRKIVACICEVAFSMLACIVWVSGSQGLVFLGRGSQ